MAKLKDIRIKIQEKLETLTGPGKPFDFVYNFHTIENEGFPYVSVEPFQLFQEIEDTQFNKRNYLFEVYIHQEMYTRTREEALNILVDCLEEVTDLFDKDYTLGGQAIQTVPTYGGFAASVGAKGQVMSVQLMLNVEVLKDIIN